MRTTELQSRFSQMYLHFLIHHLCVCTCVYISILGLFLRSRPPWPCLPLETESWDSPIWLGWLASKPQRYSGLPLPSITWDYKHTQLCLALYRGLEDGTQVLIFQQALDWSCFLLSPFRILRTWKDLTRILLFEDQCQCILHYQILIMRQSRVY